MNDYAEGCHPRVLEALSQSNMEQAPGYGRDRWTQAAKACLAKACGLTHEEIFFVAGGTLTNALAIASILRPHEAVLSAETGHIVRHEAGAIQATGHRVISIPDHQGKVVVQDLERAIHANQMAPHMAKPRLLYLSQATELGTMYSAQELVALRELCRAHELLLFVDGARVCNACVAGDVDLKTLAQLADVFWIGGTKNGALLGEALVFSNPALARDFAYIQKQRGALMAKGRVLGISFLELFKGGLAFELARHANEMARKLAEGLVGAGHELLAPCQSNQVFVQVPSALASALAENFAFHEWSRTPCGKRCTIRLLCSWATPQAHVDAFLKAL